MIRPERLVADYVSFRRKERKTWPPSALAGYALIERALQIDDAISLVIDEEPDNRRTRETLRILYAVTIRNRDDEIDLVGVTEIGDRLKVRPKTVHVWRGRHPEFPPPLRTLATGPVWEWIEVYVWALKTRRA